MLSSIKSKLGQTKSESRHGVFMCVNQLGVLIVGGAGSGKSSLALELLHHGQQLIADDCVEFQQQGERIIGHCPPLLTGLLHQREIGLIDVASLFGDSALVSHAPLELILHLDPKYQPAATLSSCPEYTTLFDQRIPQLTLNPNNPAQLSHRLFTWIASQHHTTAHHFATQQQHAMHRQPAS